VRRERVRALLADVASGRVPVEAALTHLDDAPVDDLGFATLDHHRALRQGFPEVVFGEGKTPDQLLGICERLAAHGDGFLVTRAAADGRAALLERWPNAEAHAMARTVLLRGDTPPTRGTRTVAIVTAGTSDLPVAEEAAVTLDAFGHPLQHITDVGVAGIHRILARREALHQAAVVIVVAGMDGALPSVVGGLVRVPVIAVPTSVGYGAAFQGVAPLLTMLNSCAAGVTVCNIDNGFGAAVAAARILES
jgi:pyridinium-3,5-biscarboxylic acid mononucleotide synthase